MKKGLACGITLDKVVSSNAGRLVAVMGWCAVGLERTRATILCWRMGACCVRVGLWIFESYLAEAPLAAESLILRA